MIFSQTPPTEPGLYYFKLTEDSGIHHCEVWFSPSYNALCAGAGDGGYKPVDKFGRWWSTEFLPRPKQT